MRVAYFSNHLVANRQHGIGRFSKCLYRALQRCQPAPELLPVSTWRGVADLDPEFASQAYIAGLGRRLTAAAWLSVRRPRVERMVPHNLDLLHVVALGYPVPTSLPTIVTVHDVGPLSHPQYFRRKDRLMMGRGLSHAIRQGATFVCVSESTRTELLKFHPNISESEIAVIPEGVEPDFSCESGPGAVGELLERFPSLGGKFFLSVGAASPRKNLGRVISAFSAIHKDVEEDLVFAGGAGWGSDGQGVEVPDSARRRIHQLGFVTDEELRGLYRRASAFIYPSLFEGFGLPLIEAMASGCPVLTSNTSSMPWVAGGAAFLVDPLEVKEIASGMIALSQDRNLSIDLAAAGLERSRHFNWDRVSEQYRQIYASVAKS